MKTENKSREWRVLRHPFRMLMRGWRAGRGCVVSPRGTVFVTRRLPGALAARRRFDFELE
jgi:hypothetical protein